VERAEGFLVSLNDFTEAAKTCDLDVTRQAYEDLESHWNSVEIDIQFPSVERYNFFEHVYLENRVAEGTGLEGDELESCENMVAFAEGQAATWAEVIDFLEHSPAVSSAFDDVATLRTINQGIRLARTALDGYPEAVPASPMTAPDPAGAKAHWQQFVADYPTARPLIAFRNPALAVEVDGLVGAVSDAFAAANGPDYPGAGAALTALSGRFSLGATLFTAAGRGNTNVRDAFDPDATETVGTTGDILAALHDMRYHVSLGTLVGATTAQASYNTAVQLALSFKTGGPLGHADVALTNAVNNYVAAQSPATAKALNDQINVAEQIFVGEYWNTPALVHFLKSL
jgi:hypothetical protein